MCSGEREKARNDRERQQRAQDACAELHHLSHVLQQVLLIEN
jgi:hypothetical protein